MARSKTGLGIFLGVLPSFGLALINIAGVAFLVLYIIGVIIIAVVQSRKNNARIP